MKDIQQVAVERAINMLKGAGVTFKVTLRDGSVITNKPAKQKTSSRAASAYPRGHMSAYFKQCIGHLQPGDVGTVPFGQYDASRLQSQVSAYCGNNWGAGAVMLQMNRADSCIDVMRVM
jgi:hypothetical protein